MVYTPQVPLSMGIPRQEYWNRLAFPSPGNLPDPGIELPSLASSALAGRFFTTNHQGNPKIFLGGFNYDEVECPVKVSERRWDLRWGLKRKDLDR